MPSINDVSSIIFHHKTKFPDSQISLKPIRFKVAKEDSGKVINLINLCRGKGLCRIETRHHEGFRSTHFAVTVDGETAGVSEFFNRLSSFTK